MKRFIIILLGIIALGYGSYVVFWYVSDFRTVRDVNVALNYLDKYWKEHEHRFPTAEIFYATLNLDEEKFKYETDKFVNETDIWRAFRFKYKLHARRPFAVGRADEFSMFNRSSYLGWYRVFTCSVDYPHVLSESVCNTIPLQGHYNDTLKGYYDLIYPYGGDGEYDTLQPYDKTHPEKVFTITEGNGLAAIHGPYQPRNWIPRSYEVSNVKFDPEYFDLVHSAFEHPLPRGNWPDASIFTAKNGFATTELSYDLTTCDSEGLERGANDVDGRCDPHTSRVVLKIEIIPRGDN